MADKRMTEEDVVAELRDGMTIGIGGWGSRRKPMSIVREILRSDLRDLTVVSYGGPDVGMLCAAGKIRKLVFAFVSLDFIPLEPWFRLARQAGSIETMEIDEGMFLLGLRAAAQRLPFLPTRAGLGTSVMDINPELKTVRSPYAVGEELVAMPALPLDVAFVHVSPPDRHGFCSLGCSVDIARAACDSARVLVAQVNRRMPRSLGDGLLHVSRFAATIEVDEELPTHAPPAPSARRR